MNEDKNDELAKRQDISASLVDAVRQVLSGNKAPAAEAQDEGVDEAKQPKMKNTKTDVAGAALDPVDKRALKGKHKDRKDKDIDNDGDADSTDKYLHKRRKAVSKAMEAKEYCDCDCDCGKKVCESCDKPHKPEDIEEGAQMVRGADGQVKYKTSRMPLSLQRMARRKRPLAKRIMRSKIQVNSFDPTDDVEEGNEYNVSVKGEGGVRVKAKTPKHAASKAFQKLGVAQRHRSTIQHTVKPHTEDTDVEEGAMSRIATQSAEKKRLGADKVKGTGLDTFKKKPAKDTMIANPKTQKVRKVTPSRAKMAVKKGFVYAEHMEGLEEADMMKGQPVGVSVTMKHKSGKKVTTKFPGTHSAVSGAKSHIGQMQKKGYAVHSKDLMYGKNEAYDTPAVKKPVSQMTPAEKKKNDERRTAYNTFQKTKRDKESVNELSVNKLSKYMSKSAASVSGKDARTQDKRIAGQSMADKKIRKADGYSSAAKVGATNEARRGRPPKNPVASNQDTETRHNIVHQLRKSVSLRGNHKVEFKDGQSHKISVGHASQALNKYNSLRTTGEKSRFQKQLHHSHDSFHTARDSKTPGAAPKKPGVSLGGGSAIKRAMKKD